LERSTFNGGKTSGFEKMVLIETVPVKGILCGKETRMKSLVGIKAEHERACAEFVEAARAASYSFALAELTADAVADSHTRDAELFRCR